MALLSGPTVSGAINDPTNALARLVESEKDDRKLVNEVFLRVLNRPAEVPEIDRSLGLLSDLEKDHVNLTNELGPLEVKLAPAIAELQRQREEAITKAKADLATYDENTKFLRAEVEKRRAEQIAVAERELKDHEKLLPAQAAFWEAKNNPAGYKTTWTLLDTKERKASDKVKLTKKQDGSILASGPNGQSDYRIVAETSLTNITGVMLEVLPDDSLPKFGPGRNADGNFVLSELELKWADGTNAPDAMAKFKDARADFSQKDFPVTDAIDGKIEGGKNGWAIGGAPGVSRHLATFKLENPIASTNEIKLAFKLVQRFGDSFLIGKFRLYVTTSDDPLDFGLPEGVAEAVRAPAGERTPEQAAAVIDYYRASDTEFWKRKQVLVTAKLPLPVDPKFTELKQSLAKAEEPIRLDPHLVQLREDTLLSGAQRGNKRLTAVQDLTWALINSGSFLFNH